MTRSLSVRALSLLAAGFLLTACGDDNGSVTLVVDGSVSVGQGKIDTVDITVSRSKYDKTVLLSLQGVPAGVTAAFLPSNQVAPASSAAKLRVAISGSATLGSHTITIKAQGDGLAEQSTTVDVIVTLTGTYTLSTYGGTASAAAGGAAASTVLINRAGGHADNVALAVTGAPAGVVTSLSSASTADAAVGVQMVVGAAVAQGSYPLTVTGSAQGLTDQTTTITLNVVPTPSTASLSLPYCGTVPVWFAYQNEGFGWQVLTPTGTPSTFTFNATDKVGIAYTYSSSDETQLHVEYATRAELAGQTTRDCAGTKSIGGSVNGMNSGQTTRVSMGTSLSAPTSSSPTFTLTNVADKSLDLVAVKGTTGNAGGSTQITPDKIVLQRALNPANNSVLPALDFNGVDAFAPATANMTIGNPLNGDSFNTVTTFWSNTSTYGATFSAQPSSAASPVVVYSVPAAKLAAGDIHEVFLEGNQPSFTSGRISVSYVAGVSDRTETLPTALGFTTVSQLSSSPYYRFRALAPVGSDYTSVSRLLFYQFATVSSPVDRLIFVLQTSGYLGATPGTNWDLAIPDFTGVAGFSTVWMPNTANIIFRTEGFGGPGPLLFGATPSAGDFIKFAYRWQSPGALGLVAAPVRRTNLTRPQYLRR